MSTRTRDVESIKSLVKRIHPVDDFGPHAKILVFGNNASGKTRFCCTAPKVLVLDINEFGTRSGVGTGARTVELETWEDVASAYWYLQSGKHKYESVAIDGAGGMYQLAMNLVLEEADKRDPARPSKQPSQREYGRANELFKGMVLAYRNLPMHVIFTAIPRELKDADTEEITEVTVSLPAGARGALLGAVGIIGYMEPEERRIKKDGRTTRQWVDTMIVGRNRNGIRTKDRTNNLGDVVVRPTMPRVIDAWNTTE